MGINEPGSDATHTALVQDLLNIPHEMRIYRQWVNHKNKVPINPNTGFNANPVDSSTWGTFDEAVSGVLKYGCDGIGFVFTSNDPYCGIDLDNKANCPDIAARIQRTIECFNSYTEVSPGGFGAHIIVKGNVPAGRRKGNVEMYDQGRYFTMTGKLI